MKSRITYVFSHNSAKIKIDSDDDLPLEVSLIHIKSVLNENQNHYYYNIFLGKCSNQLAKKQLQQKFLIVS